VFRFGGGNPENIAISNCVIYETYGCPIKMQFGPESKARNLLFSNLILQDVTGPITISLNGRRNANAAAGAPAGGFVRNIAFSGIRASVVAEGAQYPDMAFQQSYRPGETRQCIVLNAIGDAVIEGVSFRDVHVTYGGGGTAEEAEREAPQAAGEYFEIGTPPAYGLYARNVRGLTMDNVRFEAGKPDLRPAVVLDHVADFASSGLSAAGNAQAKSVLRFIETQDALLTATRVLTPAAVFLQLEGAGSRNITMEGGDLTKAANRVTLGAGVRPDTVTVRG